MRCLEGVLKISWKHVRGSIREVNGRTWIIEQEKFLFDLLMFEEVRERNKKKVKTAKDCLICSQMSTTTKTVLTAHKSSEVFKFQLSQSISIIFSIVDVDQKVVTNFRVSQVSFPSSFSPFHQTFFVFHSNFPQRWKSEINLFKSRGNRERNLEVSVVCGTFDDELMSRFSSISASSPHSKGLRTSSSFWLRTQINFRAVINDVNRLVISAMSLQVSGLIWLNAGGDWWPLGIKLNCFIKFSPTSQRVGVENAAVTDCVFWAEFQD